MIAKNMHARYFTFLIRFRCKASALLSAFVLVTSISVADDLTRPLKVSADGHFLAQPDGSPFFWLADTGWSMLMRLTREETDRYLKDRAAKGFNVIQAVAVGGPLDFLDVPNRYGELPLLGKELSKPNPRYFEHVDWVIDRAASYGIRIALLPVWGQNIRLSQDGGSGPVHAYRPSAIICSVASARAYGRWIGERYRGKGVIWVLGGDVNPIWITSSGGPLEPLTDYRPVYDAMAAGIAEGEGGDPFITFHPTNLSFSGSARPRTSLYFHERSWLDMNMLQSSHFVDPSAHLQATNADFSWTAALSYQPIADEYRSTPVRPIIDGEPRFEDLTIDLDKTFRKGYWSGYDARHAAYQALFAGAAGHTYGNHSIWQFVDRTRKQLYQLPREGLEWQEALARPSNGLLQYAKALLLSRPYFTRIPDQSLIVGDAGEGMAHIGATRDRSGDYAMIYVPQGQEVTIDLTKLSGARLTGWWYDPRTGAATRIKDDIARTGIRLFTPPSSGKENDWVLVLDNQTRGFTAPGAQSTQPAESVVDADGMLRGPTAAEVPYSSLASEEAKRNFVEFAAGFARLKSANAANAIDGNIHAGRKVLDDLLMRPGVERLRAAFPVSITPEIIGGVQTDVIMPQGGVAARNKQRLLINVHGGGFMAGARYGGQQESIPIASLGKIKVITIDYRMAPEHKFPAASEDVAAVYRELLKQYQPKDIGIYGCSAGGMLAAQSLAWFQTHNLPRPGAIGIFGAGGVLGQAGDSDAIAQLLAWGGMPVRRQENTRNVLSYFSEADLHDPLVAPARSPEVLRKFPPSLLISGTRDAMLSATVHTHAQLVKANVEADLHVWEGAPHCSFAQPVVDPAVPETREAWDVIVEFFDEHLGQQG